MEKLIDALITHGYYIWDDFLDSQSVADLREAIPANWKLDGRDSIECQSLSLPRVV